MLAETLTLLAHSACQMLLLVGPLSVLFLYNLLLLVFPVCLLPTHSLGQ